MYHGKVWCAKRDAQSGKMHGNRMHEHNMNWKFYQFNERELHAYYSVINIF